MNPNHEHFTYKRVISSGAWDNSKGGIYNPSFLLKEQYIKGIVRVEDKIIGTLEELFSQTSVPYYIYCKNNNLLTGSPFNLKNFPSNQRIEDFRLFRHLDKDYCSFVIVPYFIERKDFKCYQALAEVDFKTSTLTYLTTFKSPINKATEKNWGFFSLNDKLYFIYSVSPWLIYEVLDDYSLVIKSYDNFDFLKNIISLLSISTLPIEIDNQFLTVIHCKENNNYIQYALTFDKNFQVLKCCEIPILKGGWEKGHKYKEGILYTSSVVLDKDILHFYYGEGDAHTSVYSISLNNFKNLTNVFI